MSHRFQFIAAVVAVCATAPAIAAAPAAPAPLRLAAAQAPGAKPAQQRPANRADVVKQAEASFHMVDTNNDRSLTKPEIDAAQARSQQQAAANIQQRLSQEFTKLDTDRNGQLSLAEFRAAAPIPRAGANASATAMQRLDANKDGKITVEEYRAPMLAGFDRVDTNKDGTISEAEGKAAAARTASR